MITVVFMNSGGIQLSYLFFVPSKDEWIGNEGVEEERGGEEGTGFDTDT